MKNYNVPRYENRVSKMSQPGDEDTQLRIAKAYMMRLRGEQRKNPFSKTVSDALKESELVVRKLRQNIFDLADSLEPPVSLEQSS